MRYTKPHRTFEDQISLLESRGLNVQDQQQALWSLRTIGYYRLSGYWYVWRRATTNTDGVVVREDDFIPGHDFEHALTLYSFDRRLRLILLDALERIEVAFRVQISYVAGKTGPLAYLDPSSLGTNAFKTRAGAEINNFDEFLARNSNLIHRSKEIFAPHIK